MYVTKARRDSYIRVFQHVAVRLDIECLPARSLRRDTADILGNSYQFAAAPRMIDSSAAETILSDIPSLEQCSVERMIHHRSISFFHSADGIVALTHHEKCLCDIFFHVRAGMEAVFQHIQNLRIFVFTRNSGNHRKSLHPVIGTVLIVRVTVFLAVPAFVVRILHTCHCGRIFLCISLMTKEQGHLMCRFQCQIMPSGENKSYILVVAPVAPSPAAGPEVGQPGVIQCPDSQILADSRIYICDSLLVSGIHIIVPEPVPSDARKHLARKFFAIVAGRNRREQDAVRALPGNQFVHTLLHQCAGSHIGSVEALSHKKSLIAPPLCPFPFRTVEERVPHIDIQGPERFLPISVDIIVTTTETAGKFGGVSSLPVGYFIDSHSFRRDNIEDVAVQPALRLIDLLSWSRYILGSQVYVSGRISIVSVYRHQISAHRVGDIEHRSHLKVVREIRGDGVCLFAYRNLCLVNALDAEVLPLRYRAQNKFIVRCFALFGYSHRLMESHSFGRINCLPAFYISTCIKSDIGFRQSEIRMRSFCIAIGRMYSAPPGAVAYNPLPGCRHFKQKSGLA